MDQPNSPLTASFEVSSRIASALVMLLGGIVILGLFFDMRLPEALPSLNAVSPNAALGFILTGVSLWLCRDGRGNGTIHRITRASAMCIALMGALTFTEHLFEWDLGIDQLLFKKPVGTAEMFSQVRMSPSSALSFILMGVTLLLLDAETRHGRYPAEFLALASIGNSLLVFIGYLVDFPIYGIGFYNQMAFYSAGAFILLNVAVLFMYPSRGLMARITSEGASGFLMRRFLPAAIGVPIALGWFKLLGHRAGFYDVDFGRFLIVLSSIIVFTAMTWWNAGLLNKMEKALRSEQRKLEEANERLKKMDRLKTDFVNTLNHELKTPLASILGGIHLVLENVATSLTPEQLTFLQTVKNNVDRLNRLVENLLDISKIEAGHTDFRLAPFELSLLMEESISSHHFKAKEKGIHLSSSTVPGILQVHIDHDRILEVLDNLINNAMKFTPPGGEVKVMARQWDERFVCVDVVDTGIGIKKEDQKKLFEKFTRITNKDEKIPEGTGLGLAICKAILEGHGGRIWVESDYRKGCRFYFTIPLYRKR